MMRLKNRVDFSEEVVYNSDKGKKCAWMLEIKEADMLKLEIKMDEEKIVADRKYRVESIYQALEQAFARYRLNKTEKSDGTLCFVGNGNPKDYGAFGSIITSLKEKAWFMDYVTKWIWYNSDDGETEDDFTVEDVLYHYTKKLSVA